MITLGIANLEFQGKRRISLFIHVEFGLSAQSFLLHLLSVMGPFAREAGVGALIWCVIAANVFTTGTLSAMIAYARFWNALANPVRF
jgi:hypothetical protein